MRFTAAAALALAVSATALPATNGPTREELLMKARALAKRNNAMYKHEFAKRNMNCGNDMNCQSSGSGSQSSGSGSQSSGSGSMSSSSGSGNITDVDILNFALNLEYLEAQYYHIAVYGTQLSQDLLSGTGNRGYIQDNAGQQVPFSSDVIKQYAMELAHDEMDHVKFLRSALGSNAIAMPEINLNQSFTDAARAAGVIGNNETFSPFDSDAHFLLGATLFEELGVTAYNGAAPLISSKTYLGAAASILAVEAYHSSLLRTSLYDLGQSNPALIKIENMIADAEAKLGNGKSQGIKINGTSNIVPTDSNSLAFARTPGVVLNVAYLGMMGGGGFFPKGVNGALTMATSS